MTRLGAVSANGIRQWKHIMAEQTTQQLNPAQQKRFQNLFNKGFAAFERGGLDMAVELLYQCLEIDPGNIRARKFLRMASLQRYTKKKHGALAAGLAELGGMGASMKAASALKSGKHAEAILAAEKALLAAPLSVKFETLAAQCCAAAGFHDSAALILETGLQVDMQNEALMYALIDAYTNNREWRKAREILVALVNKHPQDGALVSRLKDVDARMTMDDGGWNEVANSNDKEGYRKLIKNKDQAAKLDQAAKSMVVGDDAETLIAEQKAKIAKEPKNLNYYKGLARIYQQNKRYDEAVDILEKARELNPSDPELDRHLTMAKTQSYDARIDALQSAGDADGAQALTDERNQFVFDDLVSRVERYPNDLHLRYELGQQYLMYEAYDDAIQQFQLSQRAPKERTASLYGLASCFRQKGQRDMAVMQLETALDQLPVMDDMKKAVLFDLGEIAEETGDVERAFKLYKEVYGADIAYKDIDAKMQRIYKLRQEQQDQNKAQPS